MADQLTIDGHAEPIKAPAAPAEPPAPLFDAAPFAPRVPGTIALEVPACTWCSSGSPAVHEWLEDDGGAGVRLRCCASCALEP